MECKINEIWFWLKWPVISSGIFADKNIKMVYSRKMLSYDRFNKGWLCSVMMCSYQSLICENMSTIYSDWYSAINYKWNKNRMHLNMAEENCAIVCMECKGNDICFWLEWPVISSVFSQIKIPKLFILLFAISFIKRSHHVVITANFYTRKK